MRATRILIVIIAATAILWLIAHRSGWLAGGSAVAVPSTQTTLPATRATTQPSEIPGVKNFAKVSEVLYRGEQPTREGFEQLKKMGVKTIVNLRSFHSDRDDMNGLGFQYAHITCKAWHPEDEDTTKFIKIMQDRANLPVFVHCQQGADRTGTCVALYRIIEQGWSVEEAVAEMPNFGFHTVWKPIIEYMRKFETEEFRRELKDAKPARVEVVP